MKNVALLFAIYITIGFVRSTEEALRHGANDVVVVKRSDGSFVSTKWEGQFGKMHSIFQSREGKVVHIFVNNVPARPRMQIADAGNILFEGSSENYMTSRDLTELNLKPGKNTGKYIAHELEEEIDFNVFLYTDQDKLVITDIDGTITESDIQGHVLPRLGITAEHDKVVELFDRIEKRGYHLIYLTARSFSQDLETKDYLFQMLQQRKGYSLPQGSVLFSPSTFIDSLLTEVIVGNPEVQKTKTILDVWNAFNSPNKAHIMDTIVAAYGNKESDVKAYLTAGIDASKIYIVNPEGELVTIGNGEVSSYAEQVKKINQMYPVVV